jgi:hypothetical protein
MTAPFEPWPRQWTRDMPAERVLAAWDLLPPEHQRRVITALHAANPGVACGIISILAGWSKRPEATLAATRKDPT